MKVSAGSSPEICGQLRLAQMWTFAVGNKNNDQMEWVKLFPIWLFLSKKQSFHPIRIWCEEELQGNKGRVNASTFKTMLTKILFVANSNLDVAANSNLDVAKAQSLMYGNFWAQPDIHFFNP